RDDFGALAPCGRPCYEGTSITGGRDERPEFRTSIRTRLSLPTPKHARTPATPSCLPRGRNVCFSSSVLISACLSFDSWGMYFRESGMHVRHLEIFSPALIIAQ